MTMTIESVLEQLKTLTLLDTTYLVKQIEEAFEVDASAPSGGGFMMPPSNLTSTSSVVTEEPKIEEKTSFDVILESVPKEARLETLKIIRKVTNLKIPEARDFSNALPQALVENKPREDAEEIKKQLDACGAISKIV